ncbi:hypothetical protein [Tortoise microvirus 88]|nr:hypothetical protein [Tortoise microvirus 88]
MAYRKRARNSRRTNSSSYARRAPRSNYRQRSSRGSTRRRSASGGRAQVVRIVLEQAAPSIPRAPLGLKEAPAPRKAKF